MQIAAGMAFACLAVHFFTQYRYAMHGAPRKWQWRLALFVAGAALGPAPLLPDTAGRPIRVAAAIDLRTMAVVMVATATIGGVASAWFIPIGLQRA